jgi:hypothetical protein
MAASDPVVAGRIERPNLPRAPNGLSPSSRRLWKQAVGEFVFGPAELALLESSRRGSCWTARGLPRFPPPGCITRTRPSESNGMRRGNFGSAGRNLDSLTRQEGVESDTQTTQDREHPTDRGAARGAL